METCIPPETPDYSMVFKLSPFPDFNFPKLLVPIGLRDPNNSSVPQVSLKELNILLNFSVIRLDRRIGIAYNKMTLGSYFLYELLREIHFPDRATHYQKALYECNYSRIKSTVLLVLKDNDHYPEVQKLKLQEIISLAEEYLKILMPPFAKIRGESISAFFWWTLSTWFEFPASTTPIDHYKKLLPYLPIFKSNLITKELESPRRKYSKKYIEPLEAEIDSLNAKLAQLNTQRAAHIREYEKLPPTSEFRPLSFLVPGAETTIPQRNLPVFLDLVSCLLPNIQERIDQDTL